MLTHYQSNHSSRPRPIHIFLPRSKYQYSEIEDQMVIGHTPYRINGAKYTFFNRSGIKTAISYLKLIENPDNDPAIKVGLRHPAWRISEVGKTKIAGTKRKGIRLALQ